MRFHAAVRATHGVGHLPLGQVQPKTQDQRLPLPGRQRTQGAEQRGVGDGVKYHGLCARHQVGAGMDGLRGFAPVRHRLMPASRARQVHHGSPQVATSAGVIGQAFPPGMQPNERVLGNVFRVGGAQTRSPRAGSAIDAELGSHVFNRHGRDTVTLTDRSVGNHPQEPQLPILLRECACSRLPSSGLLCIDDT